MPGVFQPSSFDPDDIGCVSAVAAADLVLAHAQLQLKHEALQRKCASYKAQLRDARAATTRVEMQLAAAALDHRKALAGAQEQGEQLSLELAALHREFGRRDEWSRTCAAAVDDLLREQRREFLREIDAHEARVGATRVQHTTELSELAARNSALQRDLAAAQAALAAATAAANLRAAAAARGLPVGVQTEDDMSFRSEIPGQGMRPSNTPASNTTMGVTDRGLAGAVVVRDGMPTHSRRSSAAASASGGVTSADASRCDLAALATPHDAGLPPRQPPAATSSAMGASSNRNDVGSSQQQRQHPQHLQSTPFGGPFPHTNHTSTAPGTPMSQASSLARLQQVYQRAPTLASIGLGPGGGWVDASTQSLPPLNAVVPSTGGGGGHGDAGVSSSGVSFFAGGTGSNTAAADQSLQSLRPLCPVMFDYRQQPSQQPAQQQQQRLPVAAMRRGSTDSSRAAGVGALHSYRVDVSGVDAGVDDSTLHSYHSFF